MLSALATRGARWRRARDPFLVALLALAVPLGVLAQDPDDPEEEEQEQVEGQEGLPLAPDPSRTLEFTATEGSWISVDISPDGQTLVFDLLGDIYTMPASGGRATPFTQGMAVDAQPRFSPDGTRIMFTSDRSGGEGVWIISLDKQDTVQVTSGKTEKYDSPEWAPDGEYILVTRGLQLYMYHVSGGSGVQLIRPDEDAAAGRGRGGGGGGNQRYMGAAFGGNDRYVWYAQRSGSWEYNTALPDYQLGTYDRITGETQTRTGRQGSGFRPTLSPDGRWLVYGTRYNAQTGLRIRDLNSAEERWLVYPVQRDDQESRATLDVYPGMTFTPDSRNLIYFNEAKLWSIPVAGGPPRNIPFEAPVKQYFGPEVRFDYPVDDSPTFTVKQIRDASPSPDDSRIAFIAMDRLFVMNYPDGEPQRLTDGEVTEFNPVWSPDGQWIAYASWSEDDGGHVMRVRADGSGTPERISDTDALYQNPVYTPDGTRVIASRSAAAAFTDTEIESSSEYVWFPSEGGSATFMMPTSGLSNLHFAEFINDPDRILGTRGGTVVSVRWDGTDEREVVQVGGGGRGGGGGGGGGTTIMAPRGDLALAAINNDIFVVKVPRVGGAAPSISVGNPENAAFPARKLTEIGGQFPAWSADGRKVHWSIGNAHVVYDIDAAEAFEDSLEAAQPAGGQAGRAGGRGGRGGGRGGNSDTPRFEPTETRVMITAQRDIPNGVAVLRGGRVITMVGDEVIENADIVVRNDRIEAVGPSGSLDIPSGARVIDITGTTVTPGFVDTHAHLRARGVHRNQNWSYVANLAFGVTSTRDPQTGTTDVLSFTDMVEAGKILGPRIFSTGPGVFSRDNINSLEYARTFLKRYSDYYHTNTIKQYVAGNREVRQWIIQAAKELELMPTTEGSLDIEMNLSEALDGYSGHEHTWPTFPLQSDLIRLFAHSGIAYTPTTLVAYGGPWGENYWYATEDVIGDEKLARFTPSAEIDAKARRRADGWFHPTEHVFPLIGETVKDLIEAGGRAGIGSHGQLQGLGYHWELWSVASGGLSNHDALRVATIIGADDIGVANDLGSIVGGKMADMVILNSNPLDDLRNTKDIRYVMKNGRLYDGNTLDEIYPTPRSFHFYWQMPDPNTQTDQPPEGSR